MQEEYEAFEKVEHLRCAAHVLNLVVGEALKKKKDLKIFRNLAATTRNSTKLLATLEELSLVFKEKFVRPIMDVETRWNSTFDMGNVLLALRKSVTALQQDYASSLDTRIEESNWEELQFLVDLLSPFKDATVILSGSSYITVPTINSIFAELGVHLLSEKYNFFTREMYFKLSEYWNKQGVFVEVATFLDPRIKLSNHQERDVRENILQMIKAYLSARYPESSSSSAQETEEAIFFRRLRPKKPRIYTNDIQAYLTMSECEDENPLLWWKRHAHGLPRLYQAARDHLATPATSVPCEQAFSASGQLELIAETVCPPETSKCACPCGRGTEIFNTVQHVAVNIIDK